MRQIHIFAECPSCGSKMKVLPGYLSLLTKLVVCENKQCENKGRQIQIDMMTGMGDYRETPVEVKAQ